jgi:hypothetical protein
MSGPDCRLAPVYTTTGGSERASGVMSLISCKSLRPFGWVGGSREFEVGGVHRALVVLAGPDQDGGGHVGQASL